jgi:cytochrome c553
MTLKISEITRREFVALKGKKCERCGATEKLQSHHKDGNRRHNSRKNHETLCKSCHMREHDCASHFPPMTEKQKKEIAKFMKARHAAGLVNTNSDKQRKAASERMKRVNKTAVRDNLGRNKKLKG